MKVKIKGVEYEFSFDSVWGPIYTYEELAGSKLPFDANRMLCLHILYYCILLRANPGITLTLEEFFEALNDISLVGKMADYYAKRMQVLTGSEDGKESSNICDSDKKKD